MPSLDIKIFGIFLAFCERSTAEYTFDKEHYICIYQRHLFPACRTLVSAAAELLYTISVAKLSILSCQKLTLECVKGRESSS